MAQDKKVEFTEEEVLDRFSNIVRIVSHKVTIPGFDHDDVMQEAWMYLLSALQRFDPEKGKLESYLYNSVLFRLKQLQGKNQFALGHDIRSLIGGYSAEKERDPELTADKFIASTKMFKSYIKNMKKYLDKHDKYPHEFFVSLDSMIEQNPGFSIAIPAVAETELQYEEMISICQNTLSPLESMVFFRRLNEEKYREISDELKIPISTLHNIFTTAQDKLQTRIADYLKD